MRKINIKITAAVCVLMMILAVPAGAVTHFVSPGQSIQAAIDDANDADEIEVAPGTYNEAIDFKGKAVRLYSSGGRDVTTIDGNGAYHVVQCVSGEDANTILEGFSITGGNANGPDPNDKRGGGMWNFNSSPTVINCTFSENLAGGSGGGMYNYYVSSPTVINCTFSSNYANNSGGGMYNNYSNLTLTNCTFSSNYANNNGGGMWNFNSSPTVINCTFSENLAGGSGGGMYNYYVSSPTVINCTFSSNYANNSGGGMYNNYSNLTLTNCTFSSNYANNNGGGMYNGDSNPTMINCTFTNNSADGKGGGMYNWIVSNPTVTNCIFWDDTPDEFDGIGGEPIVTYSDVQGGWPGTGNIDADPLFVNAAGGDFRMSSSASPCVDAGDNSVPGLPATDLAGNPRVADGDRNGTATVDMGAYEFQTCLIHNITLDHWYEAIQTAIDAADNGDEIEVAPGTYYEAINFKGKAVHLYSSGGPEVTTIDGKGNYHVVQCISSEHANTILEGFTITGGNADGSSPHNAGGGMYNGTYSSPTVINCTFIGNSADWGGGMYNDDFSSPTVINCTFIGNSAVHSGGGMHNEGSSRATVTDCTFSSNYANNNGGGMRNDLNYTTVTNCNFSENEAHGGGGLYNFCCSPTVTKCIFWGNTATTYGGGMLNTTSSTPTVTNCTFSKNEAVWGGGMYNWTHSSPTVTNCIFSDNTATGLYEGGGGGMYNSDSSTTVTNSTFNGNTAASNGGGMYNFQSNLIVTNCILWGDTPSEIYYNDTSPSITYSDVQGGWPGEGNINADPCFVDANNPDPNLWNLHLKTDSPCIDAGDTTMVFFFSVLDPDGYPRAIDDPHTPNTGRSVFASLNVVDMGAYEFQPCRIAGDSNCDGVVDFKDLAILCNNWLAGTEPK